MSYRDRERDWDEVSYPSSRSGHTVKRYPLADDRSYLGNDRQVAEPRRYDYDYNRDTEYDSKYCLAQLID